MSNEIIFGTQVASIVVYMMTVFSLYRILVAQKDATIENLRTRLAELESKSPDKTLEMLERRKRIIEEELSRVEGEKSVEITRKEKELSHLREIKEKLEHEYKHFKDLASEFFCPHCESPMVDRGFGSETLAYGDREIDVEYEWNSFECGYSLKDGAVVAKCSRKKILQ